MSSQEVQVEKIIVDAMINIITKLHATKPPLAFPNIIARLCEEMEVPYLASEPVELVPKAIPITTAVMENLRYPPVQPYFHQKQPANTANMPQRYGWGQLQEDMANLNKNQTEFYDSILAQQAAYGLCLQDLETRNMYTHWGLQQGFPSLVPNTPSKIPGTIRNNFLAGKPLFEGMLRPWPPEGSTLALGQQDPPAVDFPRD
ncbi:hypothetical protein PIB30_081613 [Stylosanthes scabra]|uniref:Uncharacterized protein n=1 Tax=Stylosanthes scabra TaxID=79078 RepID=A0ABU6ZR25_9FABA|nr:hypothetical protein [Stylosanthes scabra]